MKKLNIFYPKNAISFHKTTIVLLFLVVIILLIHLSKKIFPEDFENLDLLNVLLIVVTFIYFIFYLIYTNLFRYELENGTYSGYLIIENDKIICDRKTYLIDEIEKISILNYYYRGQSNGKISALESKRSNGLKNYIEITVNNKIDKYYFLQTKKENIKMFSNEIKEYYEKGLLGKQNFENIVN
jgi:hypothetical protein